MRVFTAIIVLLSLLPTGLLSQDHADGISYQAVALDVHGRELTNTDVSVRFSILKGAERTLLYQETHDKKTDEHGLLSVVIGHGTSTGAGTEDSLGGIRWGKDSLFLRVEIDVAAKGSYRLMGEQQMMAVPFAMHAASATAYKMQAGSWHDAAEPVFQVTNSSGQVVFAVYESGVEITVDDPGKGTRGGFAVGGFSSQKGGLLQEYLRVDPGYVRISIDDDPLKGTRGGFAVGGFSSRKSGLPDYLSLWPDRAEFMLEQDLSKGTRGGFAVGGFSSQKGYQLDQYLFAAHDSVRFFIDDSDDKGTRGGFAVGGFSSRKQGDEFDFMRIEPGFLRLAIEQPDDVKGTRGGFAVGGFSSRKSDLPDYFSLTPAQATFTLDLDGVKGTRGGFAVGGFSSHKGDLLSNYLYVTHDSVRVSLNAMGKGVRGGFAVGGMSGRKGMYQDILYTTPELTEIYTRDSDGKFLGGFTVYGLDEFLQGTDLFQVTSLETRVTTVFAVVPTVRTSEQVTDITAYSAAAGGEVISDGDADIMRRGIVWSLRERPRVDTEYSDWTGEVIAEGSGLGSFTGEMEDLLPGRQYFVRAYAENKAGAGYGIARSFWTNNIITVTSQGDGFIEPEGTSFELERGESMTFYFYPDYEADNQISDVLLNGVSVLGQVTIGEGGMGTYVFTNNVVGEQELMVVFGEPTEPGTSRSFSEDFRFHDEQGWAVLGYDVFAYVESEVNEMIVYGDPANAILLLPIGATRDDFTFTLYPGSIYEGVYQSGFGRMGFKSLLAAIIADGDLHVVYTEDIADFSNPDLTILASVTPEGEIGSIRLDMERMPGNDMLVSAYMDDNLFYSDIINNVDEGLFQGQMFIRVQGDYEHETFAMSIDGVEVTYNDYIEEYGLFDDSFINVNTPWVRDGNNDIIGQSITISDGRLNFNYTGTAEHIDLMVISPAGPVTDFSIELSGGGSETSNADFAVSRFSSYGNYVTAFLTDSEVYIGYEHQYGGFTPVGVIGIDLESIETIKFSIRYNAGDLDVYFWKNGQMVMHEVIVNAPYELLVGHIGLSYSGEQEIEISNYIDNAVIRYGDHLEEIIDPGEGITDIDGNFYSTVMIGDQLWMSENLRTTRYRNGDQIADPGEVDWTSVSSEGAYIVYDYSQPEADGINSAEEMADYYGFLYSFGAVQKSAGLCPAGWYVPAIEDFSKLIEAVGGDIDAALKLKSARTVPDPHPRWDEPNTATTGNSGFEGLPGGSFYVDYEFSEFYGLGETGNWWTSTGFSEFDGYFENGYKKEAKEDLRNSRESKSSKDFMEGEGGFYLSMSTYDSEVFLQNDYFGNSAFSVRCKYGFGIPRLKRLTLAEPGLDAVTLKGHIIDDGGMGLTSAGVVWSTEPDPDLDTNEGMSYLETPAFGDFTIELEGLDPDVTYFARAFATTTEGKTGYGTSMQFKTFFGTASDYDGNEYYTMMIGEQLWMAENLRTTSYNNGAGINGDLDSMAWESTGTGAYAVYPHTMVDGINSDAEMLEAYGALYNWYAVATGNLCPAGWRVASDSDWMELEVFLGMGEEEATWPGWRGDYEAWKLKSTRTVPDPHPRWDTGNSPATNESGFSALPGGERSHSGSFQSLGYWANWWTATEVFEYAWARTIEGGYGDIQRSQISKNTGYSVRCVEGEPPGVEFGGGSGTELDPYLVQTAEHLYNVRYEPGAYFRQEAIIILDEQPFINPENGWEPIGTSETPFTGSYNGQGLSITGLWINRGSTDHTGLFGYTSEAEIHNLVIEDADITGANSVGILIGIADNTEVVSVNVSGVVYGNDWVGGLAGRNTGETGLISQSSAAVEITGIGVYTGGLVGFSDFSAIVSESFSTGTVDGEYAVGGLVGWHGGGSGINNSYSSAVVSGNAEVGGLVGRNDGAIMNSYSTGFVSGELGVGGLVGFTDPEIGSVNASYWDTETSGITVSDGGLGRLTILMVRENTFEDWDFIDTWSIDEEITYPYLQWQVEPEDHNYANYLGVQTIMGAGVTDIEGNFYETVIIGDQEWMAENLRTTTYNPHVEAAITYLPDDIDWQFAEEGAYSIYWYELVDGIDNETQMIEAYGILYNWFAVETGELCPVGWRVPTSHDWIKLVEYLDDTYDELNTANIGNALRDCRQEGSPLGGDCNTPDHPRWNMNPTHFGTDIFGFSALPAGRRSGLGTYFDLGSQGNWWSWTETSEFNAASRVMNVGGGGFSGMSSDKYAGFSVRCIKSDEVIDPAIVITNVPDSIGYYDAILSGTVDELNGETVIGRGFYWGTDPFFMEEKTYNGSGPGDFTAFIGDLSPETTYYYTTYAYNESGYSYGDTLSFTTLALTEGYIYEFAGDLFLTYWQVLKNYNIGMTAQVAADQTTASWGNFAWLDMSDEPRTEWNNHPRYPNEWLTRDVWEGFYRIIDRSNDALHAILVNGMQINEGDDNEKVVATLYLMRGLAHGQLGMVFDQAYIKDYEDTGEPFFSSWEDVILAGISDLQTAIGISDEASPPFTWGTEVMPGHDVTSTFISQLANSHAARFLAQGSRAEWQNEWLDWTYEAYSWVDVYYFAENGLAVDFAPVGDGLPWNGGTWYDLNIYYLRLPGWGRVDMRVINLLDPEAPVRYPTDEEGLPLEPPQIHAELEPGESESADQRLYTDFEFLPDNNFVPERGGWHFSHYRHSRYDSEMGISVGPLYEFRVYENELIKAEALLRGFEDAEGAAAILNDVNNPRIARGNLDPVDEFDDIAILDAIMYERYIELFHNGWMIHFHDMRRTDYLQYGTPLHFPVPGQVLEDLGQTPYTFGGFDNADGINTSEGGEWIQPYYHFEFIPGGGLKKSTSAQFDESEDSSNRNEYYENNKPRRIMVRE